MELNKPAIKAWGSEQDAKRVAAKLKGRDVLILFHVGFMGTPNWIIRYNGNYLLTTDKVVINDTKQQIKLKGIL